MFRPSGIIALQTDFGVADHFVGTMKGVILSINPEARLVDLGHWTSPHNIREAMFQIRQAAPHFPEGTIFVSVVDPGVGTNRAILCAVSGANIFLAPDNGLISFLPARAAFHRVTNRAVMKSPISYTFHGRDIFAPVAARLSMGLDPAKLGPRVRRIVRLPTPEVRTTRDGALVGEVVSVDRFGNMITNIPASLARKRARETIRIGPFAIQGISKTYGSGRPGQLVAVIGSSDTLEIAQVQGAAVARIGIRAGVEVRIGGRTSPSPPRGPLSDDVYVIETNLDNAPGESIGWLFDRLLEEGALDVFVTPIQMKKSRPGIILTVLAPIDPAAAYRLERVLLAETPTFGVRRHIAFRTKLAREIGTVRTRFGTIRCKIGYLDGKALRAAPEYEDVRAAAQRHGVPLETVLQAAQGAAARRWLRP